jgi:hypothetical protein
MGNRYAILSRSCLTLLLYHLRLSEVKRRKTLGPRWTTSLRYTIPRSKSTVSPLLDVTESQAAQSRNRLHPATWAFAGRMQCIAPK